MKYTSEEEKKKVGRDKLSRGAVVAAKTFLCRAGIHVALCCVHQGSLAVAGGSAFYDIITRFLRLITIHAASESTNHSKLNLTLINARWQYAARCYIQPQFLTADSGIQGSNN